MKATVAVIILAVICCICLGVALVQTKKQAADEKQKDTAAIAGLSNNWAQTESKWHEQQQVNAALEKDIEARKQQITELTNKVGEVSATLAKTETNLKATQEAEAAAKAEIVKRDARIAELEQQNKALDLRANDLSTAITNLTGQIDETKRKLSASEGDKAFLEKELKRLMAEKAELERQFNDLAVVRAQVAKLREELNVSRRLEWIRKGLFPSEQVKGATLLMKPAPATTAPATNHYDLNVEVNSDGSVRVIPPLTNAPAQPK